jgi:1,4-alpha-glucan branching enzyme
MQCAGLNRLNELNRLNREDVFAACEILSATAKTQKDIMKKQMKHKNGNGQASHRIRIEFTLPTASEVAIAGTFNDWRPDATQMVSLGDGRWLKELALSPGVYEYRLVVDGAWMADPRAGETAPNPFGGVNSVLKVN